MEQSSLSDPQRRSESSDQSPTTPKNEAAPRNEVWTKSKYRNSKPKNVNLKNVYRLETKLNDLDISEPVFPGEKEVTTQEQVEAEVSRTPSSGDLTTPRNKPFRAAVNWFDDDDDFSEEDLMMHSADHVIQDQITCESRDEEDVPFQNGPVNCVGNCHENHDTQENGNMVTEDTVAEDSVDETVLNPTFPAVFQLNDIPKKHFVEDISILVDKTDDQLEEKVLSVEKEELHDSEYDSERDEFYSSYCESPGWE